MNTQIPSLKKLSSAIRYFLIFLLGGIAYFGIEMIYRGYSHWSMALLGGVCLVAMCLINRRFPTWNLFLRAALCAIAVTILEFIAGCVLNLWLDWHIWDYHALPFNLLGQIAPLYTFFWFLLSLPICFLYSKGRKKRA